MRLLAAILLGAGLIASPARGAATEPCFNGFLLTADRRVERFDETAAGHVPADPLRLQVNALAFLPREDLFYAVSGDRVVTLDSTGRLTDRGPAPDGMRGAWSGTELNGEWIVHNGREMLTVHTPDLVVTQRVRLADEARVGDWDTYAGSLYGILDSAPAKLVAVDPGTGAAAVRAVLPGLPSTSSYGAVVADRFGVLHALHNGTGRLYHVPLTDPQRHTHTDLGLTSISADAALCPVLWDYGDAPDSFGSGQHTPSSIGSLGIGASLVEDGLAAALRLDASATRIDLAVAVRNTTASPGLLAGWFDLDLDGGFGSDELVTIGVPPGATSVTLSLAPIRLGGNANQAWLRLRMYPGSPDSVEPFGTAAGGEVEDHEVTLIQRPPPTTASAPAPALARPSPSVAPSVVPSRQPARVGSTPSPSGRLPLTLSVFAGLLVPAITVAARAVAKKGTR